MNEVVHLPDELAQLAQLTSEKYKHQIHAEYPRLDYIDLQEHTLATHDPRVAAVLLCHDIDYVSCEDAYYMPDRNGYSGRYVWTLHDFKMQSREIVHNLELDGDRWWDSCYGFETEAAMALNGAPEYYRDGSLAQIPTRELHAAYRLLVGSAGAVRLVENLKYALRGVRDKDERLCAVNEKAVTAAVRDLRKKFGRQQRQAEGYRR